MSPVYHPCIHVSFLPSFQPFHPTVCLVLLAIYLSNLLSTHQTLTPSLPFDPCLIHKGRVETILCLPIPVEAAANKDELLRSHTTQLVHKAPHLPITRVQRAPVIARCQSREFQIVLEPTIDVPGTSQL
ncbi:hypothetical protein EGR_11138 [Echinococcus granulosus]|uniref:Uncharacterized protein n=1 Tax=Echinococcus granulosus TaxID=6210 RepID=W6UKJ0_ECHGR|nr:hypothetical protein EGR_11138 [Echinococcus granulosus]EUB54004.1 hypothetical protein EGR_11138 [Echinococcus granulosus]